MNFNVTLAEGIPGRNGSTILSGVGVPGAGIGITGDYYLDTAAGRLYGPKSGGVWGSGISLVGPTGATGATGASTTYEAIVGDGVECNYATLALALAAASAGWRILVKKSITVNSGAAFTISLANLLIEFAPNVTYTKGTLSGALFTINAGGTRIKGGRFSGFDTAVLINATKQYNFITECRFASCAAEITEDDAAPNNAYGFNITE
jgi:hypothetical protein